MTFILIFSCMGTAVGFAADNASDTEEPVRIACVGDSITYGYACSNQSTQSYPAQLQKLLGNSCLVSNFGVNSSTGGSINKGKCFRLRKKTAQGRQNLCIPHQGIQAGRKREDLFTMI